MPIDPNKVTWGSVETVDPSKVQWEPVKADEGLPAGRAMQVGAGALAPAAAGLGLGAAGGLAAGTALGPAALIGGGLLGAAELVGQGENIVRGAFGYEPVKTPYQYIREATQAAFPSTKPQTFKERALAAGVEGLTTSLTSAGGAGVAANALRGGSKVLNVLAANPLAQGAAGGAAGAAPELATEQGFTSPSEQLAASLIGGYAAGRALTAAARVGREAMATVRNLFVPSTANLKKSAGMAFDAAKASGLDFEPTAVMDLRNTLEKELSKKFNVRGNPAVVDILDDMTQRAQGGQTSLKDLHEVREKIGNELRSDFSPDTAKQRKIGGIMVGALDNFIANPNTPTTLAKANMDPAEAVGTFKAAIDLYRRGAQSAEIERALARAERRKNVPNALQTQFGKIAENPARMSSFDENQQAVIRSLAAGETSPGALNFAAGFAPGRSLAGMAEGIATAAPAAMYAFGHGISPEAMAAAGLGMGAAATGMASRGAQSLLARRAANQLAASARGGMVAAPTFAPNQSLALPLFMQSQNAMAR